MGIRGYEKRVKEKVKKGEEGVKKAGQSLSSNGPKSRCKTGCRVSWHPKVLLHGRYVHIGPTPEFISLTA